MSGPGGILALDLSTKTGWAYGTVRDLRPDFGLWLLSGGLADMGKCWTSLQNEIEDAVALHRPALLVFAAPFATMQTTARLLLGLAAHAESQAYRCEVRCNELSEGTARKEVIGRGSFRGVKVEGRAPRKGDASKAAKAACVQWCRGKGWLVQDDNVADACVVWEYARRFLLSRQQWAPGAPPG